MLRLQSAYAASLSLSLVAVLAASAGAQLPSTLDLTGVGAAGVLFEGAAPGDEAGWSVSSAGDVNGDAVDDILIGARHAAGGAGRVYIVFGSSTLSATIDLGDVGGAVPGVVLTGAAAGDSAGWSVGGGGDVNGDGYDDVLVGAPLAAGLAGRAYLVYGGPALPAGINLGALGAAGVEFRGVAAGDEAGFSVAGAGNPNGDAFADILIGARYADPVGRTDAGQAYLVSGSAALPGVVQLPASGVPGIAVVNGVAAGDMFGFSVDGGGDVNGDGSDDLLLGGRHADPGGLTNAGQACVVFGGPGLAATTDLASLGAGGVCLNGCAPFDLLGVDVAGGADVNGDGFADPIVGARQADPGGVSNSGEAYVMFGGSSLPSSISACALGCAGVRLQGTSPGDQVGFSVAAIPDLNLDGFDDPLVGGPFAAPTGLTWQGEAWLLHGAESIAPVIPLALLGARGTDFRGAASNELAGYSVESAGDLNDDGVPDVILGAFLANPRGALNAGIAYVVFGSAFTGGSVTTYGAGCPGAGGLVPHLATAGGGANVGNFAFQMSVVDALPGAPTFLNFATVPANFPLPGGCALLVDLLAPTLVVRLPIVAGPCGDLAISIPIPPLPGIANQHVFVQGIILDPAGVLGIASLTNGIDVLIRP